MTLSQRRAAPQHLVGCGAQHILRPEDIHENKEIQLWFNGQTDAAKKIFLKYIDFQRALAVAEKKLVTVYFRGLDVMKRLANTIGFRSAP